MNKNLSRTLKGMKNMVERDEVVKLAKLSKLTLSDKEIDALTVDMQSIVSFADMISKAKYDEPNGIYAENLAPLREDDVIPSYDREDILKNAPTAEDGYFKLPRRSDSYEG